VSDIRFAKVSYANDNVKLPTRSDPASAGYDFYLPRGIILNSGQADLVFTDIKAYMPSDTVLLITIRSSLAKKGLILLNAPGVVDASYVDNPNNEGNIGLLLYNLSKDPIELKAGDRVAQGIFFKYFCVSGDHQGLFIRNGGFGSTGR